jgi:uncharacterized membrane protein (DUF106 family)
MPNNFFSLQANKISIFFFSSLEAFITVVFHWYFEDWRIFWFFLTEMTPLTLLGSHAFDGISQKR